MPVGGLKGTGAPVIKLYTGATLEYTITLSSWLKELQVMDPQWPEEYDLDPARMSDSSRTEKQYLAGFRFNLALEYEDEQIVSNKTTTTNREYFEWLMDILRGWKLAGATKTITVLPFSDNTALTISCNVSEGSKSNTIFNAIPRSVAHRHRIVLRAIGLVSEIPQQSTLPWSEP